MTTRLDHLFQRVSKLFKQADVQTRKVQLASGVRCPSGCGQCCYSPHVEAAPIELYGVVQMLKIQKLLDGALDRAQKARESKVCIFFKKENLARGSCSVYSQRPLLCRLFGFSGRINKFSQTEVLFCKRHKENQAQQIQEFGRSNALKSIPIHSEYRMRLVSEVPSENLNKLLPINEAFLKAVELDYFDSFTDGPGFNDEKVI